MPVIELWGNNSLHFRFPEIHPRVSCHIDFERTLRLPDPLDRRRPLPGRAGVFAPLPIDRFADRLPPEIIERGGLIMPMWQADALWLGLWQWNGFVHYVFALRLAWNDLNVVTGQEAGETIEARPQNYVILDGQEWLDGVGGPGVRFRQFVAPKPRPGTPLAARLANTIRISAHPLKYENLPPRVRRLLETDHMSDYAFHLLRRRFDGLVEGIGDVQEIVIDRDYDRAAWHEDIVAECIVTVVDAVTWKEITGEWPPQRPMTESDYGRNHMPWAADYEEPLITSDQLTRLRPERLLPTDAQHAGPEQPPVTALRPPSGYR